MRVVGGRLRGRNLASPSSRDIRPTADRLRESLFNILIHAYDNPVQDARVLDLFAGAGGVGPLINLSPRGKPLTQARARELAAGPGVRLICSRFEGVDERVLEESQAEDISLGGLVPHDLIGTIRVRAEARGGKPLFLGLSIGMESRAIGRFQDQQIAVFEWWRHCSQHRTLWGAANIA